MEDATIWVYTAVFSSFSVEGLLGITVDESEVFLININEIVTEEKINKQVATTQ